MKATAWIPVPTLGRSGVAIPETAVIWYMDQVYVYIKAAKDTYTRRLIKAFLLTPDGYFVKDVVKVGEEVVITGGQIPDED
ncbi:MAG: hypothetical protein O2966_04860 [Proteobacteria bacterium]|nr:hypothetical protein [Pseudomonadota bacterium]